MLNQMIESREARFGVVGLGYVGLPLAVEFAKVGFRATGFEVSRKRSTSSTPAIPTSATFRPRSWRRW